MHLYRVVIGWQGPAVVGTAVTVLHFDATNQTHPPCGALVSAFNAAGSLWNSNLTITVPKTGDIIDDTTGDLTGVWSDPAGGNAFGAQNQQAVASGVGACIGWQTGTIVNGKKGPRKLRGRTFIVPLVTSAYALDGTLSDTSLATVSTLANAIMQAGGLGIWHRPTTKGGSDGGSGAVLAYKVRDKVAFLSSRRD